jgi:hypothetical protein
VYEITTTGLFKTLYSFCPWMRCTEGPFGGLIQDSNGNRSRESKEVFKA